MIEFVTNSMIYYKSGKVLEDLRGETLNNSVIDEMRNQHKDLWPLVIRPMLGTTRGRGSFISTPNGFDAFYELYEWALAHPEEWAVFHHPSTINPLFTLEEYESARATMSDKQFRQEIEAEFLDLTSGRAYFAFGNDNLSTASPFKTMLDSEGLIGYHLPIVIGLDFNVNPMSWALGQTNKDKWYWFDEIYIENSNTPEATAELIVRLSALRDRGLLRADPQLIICGDSNGSSRSTKTVGDSDYDLLLAELKRHGFSYENQTPEGNPFVKDRVAAVNAKCRTANGEIKLFVHPTRCPRLIRDFRRVVWKDGTAQLDKTKDSSLTHMSDAVGYPIHKLTPVPEVKDVGELVVVQW